MSTFDFSNLNMILMHFVILNFQTLRIFTPFLQSAKVAVFLELAISHEKHDNGNNNNIATFAEKG